MVRRIPYTEEELEEIRKVFESMPSYNPETQLLLAEEYDQFLIKANYPHTPKQVAAYKVFFRATRNDEFISWGEAYNYISAQHDPPRMMKLYAVLLDKNKDGFISPDEFKFGIRTLNIHDPEHFGKQIAMEYEQFLEEADTNKDGKVSVQELEAWLNEKYGASS